MPTLKPETKKRLDAQRIQALKGCKTNREFGYKVANIGSKGGKDLDHSAEETGRQILQSLATDLLTELDKGTIKFSEEVVKILENSSQGKIKNKFQFEQMKWAAEQGLKIGVLGGYAPEKKQSVNLNIDIKPSDKKALSIAKKYEQELKDNLKNEPIRTSINPRLDKRASNKE